jgi:hypothetical protein
VTGSVEGLALGEDVPIDFVRLELGKVIPKRRNLGALTSANVEMKLFEGRAEWNPHQSRNVVEFLALLSCVNVQSKKSSICLTRILLQILRLRRRNIVEEIRYAVPRRAALETSQ